MSISGKRVVFGFYGALGVLALIGGVIVLILRQQPPVERDQRNLSMVLTNAYQKHRFDTMLWPTSPYDAAANFKSENPNLVERVSKAEKEWGMTVELIDPEGSPTMKVRFKEPRLSEQTFMLKKAKR
jgi:hypothetical protein